MSFVRQSKFRHIYAKPMKRDCCLEDIRITKISWDSTFCSVNPKFIAVITEGSGGPFMVIPLSKTGRINKDYPLVDAHRAPCLEVAWCPFNDNVVASCSEDCTAKVWHIPDNGLHSTLREPLVELLGHQRRVTNVLWHPTANNVLMTAAADMKIFMWNVSTGEALIEIAGHPDLIWSVAFNYNGSKIVTTCKDKKLRVIDPRSGRILQQGAGHEGVKPMRAIFVRDGKIFTTGFTKRSERQYSLRDEECIEEPIVQEELDTSNGVNFPFYDPDCNLVYLAGKGDSSVRYYELTDEAPFVHYINTYTSSEPQRGVCFMPKRGVSVKENEMARIYKCTNKGLIEVFQFFVPRKSELFQEDLYPDTFAPVAALSADEWLEGKDADPVLMPVTPEDGPGAAAPPVVRGARALGGGGGPADSGSRAKKTNILGQIPNSDPSHSVSSLGGTTSKLPPSSPGITPMHVRTTPDNSLLTTPGSHGAGETPKYSPSPRGSLSGPTSTQPSPTPSAGSVRTDWMSRDRGDSGSGASTNAASRREREPQESGGRSSMVFSRDYGSAGSRSSRTPGGSLTTPLSPGGGGSVTSSMGLGGAGDLSLDELMADVQKLKTIVKRHERRIRFLEEQLHERDTIDFD